MPKDEKRQTGGIVCPICGHESPSGTEKCENCYNVISSGASGAVQSPTVQAGGTDELTSIPGVGQAKAEILREAGYKSIKDIQDAKAEDLASIKGIGEKLATKIIKGARSVDGADGAGLADWLSGEEDGLSSWLSGEEKSPEAASATERSEPGHSDSLAKWLAGSEDGLDSWLDEPASRRAGAPATPPQELLEKEAELIQLRETLREKIGLIDSGGFDAQATVEELARTKAELDAERKASAALGEELDNVKRGSIAVIKFIKGQKGSGAEAEADNLADRLASEMARREKLELQIMEQDEIIKVLKERLEQNISELPPDAKELATIEATLAERGARMEAMERQLMAKEETLKDGIVSFVEGSKVTSKVQDKMIEQTEEYSKKEQEYVDRIHELETKLSTVEVEYKHREEMIKASAGSSGMLDPTIRRKLEDAQTLERTLMLRQQEIEKLKEDARIREEDFRKLKEPLAYKEAEMLRREEDLMFREKLLQEELKQVTQQKAEMTSMDEITLKKRLEELQAEVTAKEEEVRSKEKYLAAKEEELRTREQGLIGEEIDKREADRVLEIKQEKVKTGTSRLDDLLLGGIPFGSNVMIYGPPFAGKEVLVSAFIADGLKKGVPAMWIITEKSSKEIREEMAFVIPAYEEYEKRGLVRYIDSYSRSMGDDTKDEYTDYVDSPTDYDGLAKAIEKVAKDFKSKHEYYRVGFRSISTLIAYLDPNTAFRFLSPIAGRRKRDRAVSMFTIEKGVHGEQEIQMLGSLMDGMIEFKIENLNTFLSIKGISDVQSRAFIRYSATKSSVSIGSFSLDHIR